MRKQINIYRIIINLPSSVPGQDQLYMKLHGWFEKASWLGWNRPRQVWNRPRHFEVARGEAEGDFKMPRTISNLLRTISDQIVWGAAENYLMKYSTRSWCISSSQRRSRGLLLMHHYRVEYFTKLARAFECWQMQLFICFLRKSYINIRITSFS